MSTIDRILVATDLSEPADWAVARAAALAQLHGASLDLVHIVSSTFLEALRLPPAGEVVDPEAAMASLRTEVDRSAEEVARAYGVTVRPYTVPGKPSREILQLARECRTQLVVAGAHGRHPMHRVLFGSTTERLLYHADVPLLIVKGGPQAPYHRLLVAVDFSDCALQATRFAAQLLPEAALTLFHAVESPVEGLMRFAGVTDEQVARHRAGAMAQAELQMSAFLGTAGLAGAATRSLDYGYPIRSIKDGVDKAAPDVLVLGKHGRSVVEHWMVGSVTAHLARAVECDVLVVPDSGP
jgi:nucleotide-binding universal stress UspA family protein